MGAARTLLNQQSAVLRTHRVQKGVPNGRYVVVQPMTTFMGVPCTDDALGPSTILHATKGWRDRRA